MSKKTHFGQIGRGAKISHFKKKQEGGVGIDTENVRNGVCGRGSKPWREGLKKG
jgi:hypothetical protein